MGCLLQPSHFFYVFFYLKVFGMERNISVVIISKCGNVHVNHNVSSVFKLNPRKYADLYA
jgi:hypothetical protein